MSHAQSASFKNEWHLAQEIQNARIFSHSRPPIGLEEPFIKLLPGIDGLLQSGI